MTKNRTANFTPFVAAKKNAALRAALRLVDPGDVLSATARFEEEPSEGARWQIVVDVPLAGASVRLDLRPASPDRRSWFGVGPIQVGYRMLGDGRDPFQDDAIRPGLESIRNVVGAAEDRAVSAGRAIEEYLPYDGLRDEFYYQINYSGGDRSNGFLRLGFRCNQDCHFCWQDRSWPDAPQEYYERWLEELAAAGIFSVTITGGEPTLNRSLPDLVRRATFDHGVAVILETNAIRFAKPEYAKQLKDSGVAELFVSYHSPDARISDEMTRARGTHERTEAGILGALEAGIPINLNCVIERRNFRDLEHHARAIVERFVEPSASNLVRCVTYSMAMDYRDHALWEARAVSLDEVEPHLAAAVRVLGGAGVPVQALGTCGFPPCVLRNVPEAIWWMDTELVDAQDAAGRAHAEVCERCSERNRCLGPRWEYVRMFGDRGLVPFR